MVCDLVQCRNVQLQYGDSTMAVTHKKIDIRGEVSGGEMVSHRNGAPEHETNQRCYGMGHTM